MKYLFSVVAVAVFGSMPLKAVAQSSLSFPIVDTGQTKCYDTQGGASQVCPKPGDHAYGQDAHYTHNPPHYQDNGDGTVTDAVTGLIWEKDFHANVTWRKAPAFAKRATTGGYSDWRVPTIKELYSLIDFSGQTGSMRSMTQTPSDAKPYIDTTVFAFEYPTDFGAKAQDAVRFMDAQYIASTAYVGTTMNGDATFFGVNFADGRIKGYPQKPKRRETGYYLRLVRGNSNYGQNDFQSIGSDVILDRATGLAWMQKDSAHAALTSLAAFSQKKDGTLDWVEALKYCEHLSFGGFADWRLPNAKELQGLLDYSRAPQTTRTAAIDPIFDATPITDERGNPNFAGYWASTTHLDGRKPGTDAIVVYFGEALGAFKASGGGQNRPQMGDGPMGGPQMNRMPGPSPAMQGGPQNGPGRRMGPPPMMNNGDQPMPPPHMIPSGPKPQGQRPQGQRPQGMVPQGQASGGQIAQSNLTQDDIIDVHGAGAQRSDPKVGSPDNYPVWGHGPQGDVRRVFNHVRCVRTAN